MKQVMILSQDDFTSEKPSLNTLKPELLAKEPEVDDIFYIDGNNNIRCFKARNSRCGEYSKDEFLRHVLNG